MVPLEVGEPGLAGGVGLGVDQPRLARPTAGGGPPDDGGPPAATRAAAADLDEWRAIARSRLAVLDEEIARLESAHAYLRGTCGRPTTTR